MDFDLFITLMGPDENYTIIEKIEDLDFELYKKETYYKKIDDVIKHILINKYNPKEREIIVQVDYVGIILTIDELWKIYKDRIYTHKDLPF